MDSHVDPPLVTTIKERCRVCYTCVRECPAKAIRIYNGQAEVIPERCIGCGNCVLVCSQNAKEVLSAHDQVIRLLSSGAKVSACIAPSFPAEFTDMDYRELVGMVRALGFDFVNEVAFGADLVANRYQSLLSENEDKRYIAANCPAIVEFVCRYHPDLVNSLSPIASPMIATARVLRKMHGNDLRIVFIGPCIAKKAEKDPTRSFREIDAVLTFIEFRDLLTERDIDTRDIRPSEFDPPFGGKGALFPVARGMLQAASIDDGLLPGKVLAADGKNDFMEAIKEFETGDLVVRLLEVLCCNGCIMGPGIKNDLPLFRRQSQVMRYTRQRLESINHHQWQDSIDRYSDLDLSRGFIANDQRIPVPSEGEIADILGRMGKTSPNDELNCGACGYDTCRDHAIAIHWGTAESEMCLPYSIEQLRVALGELAVSNQQLANVQDALVQSEKLASMGQLAAGIAHEINNPLGVVLMYAHLLLDEYIDNQKLREDLGVIVEQTDRCKKIVAGLLNFARQRKIARRPSDIQCLIDRILKNVPPPEYIHVQVKHAMEDPLVEIDPDQIAQVLTNLLMNAYEAMPDGGRITIESGDNQDQVHFSISDNGVGILQENRSEIFDPFFTTKQIGKGTGLGLAIVYGIVKMHRGDISVESNSDPGDGSVGATFRVVLPRKMQDSQS